VKACLILRPEPGAAATFERATAAGFQAVASPIFVVQAVQWAAPDAVAHDALMLTSANAVRQAGPALARYRHLPAFAVGEATAAAAIEAGFADVRAGSQDVTTLVERMAREGVSRPLHLAGREYRAPVEAPFPIVRRIVYAADAVAELPSAARAALQGGAVALLHSPRAARTFADLLAQAGIDPSTLLVAAISPAAAIGPWKAAAIAEAPNDGALLAAAARLCEKGP
jgi:uroporphyrinogen-III synthase